MKQSSGSSVNPIEPSASEFTATGRSLSPYRHLRNALDAAGVPVASFDAEGHVKSANPSFAQLFSSSGESVVGSHLMGLCDNRFSAQALAALVRVVGRVSDTETVEIATASASGQRFLKLTFSASPGADGHLEKVICIGAELEHLQPDAREVLGGRRHRGVLADVSTIANEADFGSMGSDESGADEPMEYNIRSILGVVIARSARAKYPFSLLRCNIGGLCDIAEADGERLAKTLEAVCEARLNQRLRPSDRVIRGERGTFLVVAEHLGDEQDAAGVAYRLLAAMVEPVVFDDIEYDLPLTVGITVADGAASVDQVIDSSFEALSSAMGRGSGGFSIIDIRPGLAA